MSSRTDASIRNDRLLLSGRYSPTECENVDLVDALGKYISNSKLGSGRLALPESFGYFENLARVLMQLPKKLSSARTLCQFATTARPATFDLEAMLLRGGLCSAIESLETTPDHQKRKELARVPGIDAEDVATLAACGITDSAKLRAELSSSKPQWTPRTEERKKLALGYLNLGSRPEPLLDLETSLQLKTAILKRLQANPALLDEKLFIEQTGSLGAGRLTAPSAEFILSKQNAWTPDELAVVIKWLTKDFQSAQPLCVAVLSTPAMARFDRARLPMGISKYEEVPFARLVQQGPDANTYLSTLWFAASSNHATIQALTRSTKGYGEALFRVARSMQFVLHGTGLYDEAGWAANHAPLEIESEEELFAKLKVPYRRELFSAWQVLQGNN
ncbi:uncharacterized protein JCM15063_006206 [Sporobolomyces koalae]|uniref:uncharacterized protein n=1 Tax=Sporobolomyces koalae TaxID=500713 RepID=UPI00316BBD71